MQQNPAEEADRPDADVLVTVDLADDIGPISTPSLSQESGQFRTTVIVHTSTPASDQQGSGPGSTTPVSETIGSGAGEGGQQLIDLTGDEQGAVGTAQPSIGTSNIRHSNEMAHHPMGSVFRRLGKSSEARKHPPEVQRVASSNSMSVSVPNLTTSMEQTVSLLESFSAVVRRNLGNNTNNMVVGSNNPCNSLVRLALSSNSTGERIL